MTGAEVLAQHVAALGRPFAASIAALPARFTPDDAALTMFVHIATTGSEPGNWMVSIDRNACRVFLGSVAAPHARVFTSSDVGHLILTGRLSIERAIALGILDYDGDPAALRRFAGCFDFGGAA
jgi:hypothetical protein